MAAGPQDAPLYEAQQKIYPREVSGRFNTLRVIAVCALLGLFYALPWVQWNGHQAILFDRKGLIDLIDKYQIGKVIIQMLWIGLYF